MTWFVNYLKSDAINVSDRGFSYGDGVFETLLVDNACIISSNFHRQRLMRACQRLFIPFTKQDLDNAFQFIQDNVPPDGRQCVKLILSRGSGGRGYLPPLNPNLTIVIGFLSAPDYLAYAEQGVSLTVSNVKASMNSSLAGLKHLNRLENVLAKQDLAMVNQTQDAETFFESILLDDAGCLVECVQSNLFWFKNNVLFTPLLNRSGVQGTLRSRVLNVSPDNVNVGRFVLDDVLIADEIFICNSLMSIVPVTFVVNNQKQYRFAYGEKTKHLQMLIHK